MDDLYAIWKYGFEIISTRFCCGRPKKVFHNKIYLISNVHISVGFSIRERGTGSYRDLRFKSVNREIYRRIDFITEVNPFLKWQKISPDFTKYMLLQQSDSRENIE